MNQQLKEVEKIHRMWLGGLINGNRAMADIHDVLSRKYVTVNKMKIVDVKTGEIICETGHTSYSYR